MAAVNGAATHHPKRRLVERIRRKMVRENRVYIMPTGRGYLFLAVVVVMILTAATYNNNLIFILAFFMFAVFIVAMLQTHQNLRGVSLVFGGAEDSFEGDSQVLLFHIRPERPRLLRGLEIRTRSKKFVTLKNNRETVAADEREKPVRIEVLAWRRGIHGISETSLETYWPLGLFRAWKIFRPKGEIVVYPKPVLATPLAPTKFDHGEDNLGLRTSPEGDFGELKSYRTGESYHQIAWKHYARTGSLFTKVHWGEEHKHYVIPWNPGKDMEAHLCHMSGWVLQAVEDGASFELETLNQKVDPGRGPEHSKLCLRALAAVKGDW